MTGALVQFRCDEQLKNEATILYNNLGLDLSSAIKLFLKRSVDEARLPFSFDLELDDIAAIGYKSMKSMQKHSKNIGLDNMTFDDINVEIAKARGKKCKKKSM